MATAKAATKKTTKAAKSNVEQAMEIIEKLTLLEMSELVKNLEEKFGVTAAAPVSAVAAAGAVPAGAAPAAEEKTEFDAILSSIGSEKIKVIKVVRTITSLGLKEAKDLVEGAPKPIKEEIPREEAESIKKQIEEGIVHHASTLPIPVVNEHLLLGLGSYYDLYMELKKALDPNNILNPHLTNVEF